MWRRSPDVPGCTVLLIRLYVWIFLVKYLDTQELPTRDTDYAFGINQRNLFYDNNRIPDGIEVSPYLFVNTTKKFFFLLESKIERLEISVSPCASPIIWHVTYKPHRENTPIYELGNDVENTVVGYQPVINTKDVLYTLSGEVAETLRLDSPAIGVYTLEITSVNTDSYVEIYATTSPDVDRLPELPKDSNISELQVTSDSFTVAWKPTPDERHFGDDIDYCIAINRKKSFKTLCSVLSHLNGDAKPTLPPGSGFGFSSDLYRKRVLKQRAKPISAAKKGSIFFKCVGKETKFVYNKIRKGKGYYVDVFVTFKKTGKSKRFKGIYIKTKRKRRLPTLKEGKNKTVVFTKKKKVRSYLFHVKHSTKDVHLAISACSGNTNIEVKSNNGTFHKSKIKKSKILTLKDLNPGRYILALSKSSVRRRQSVYISVNTKSKNVRMPKLPKDTTVKVFDYLTSCNSITVAWMGTAKKQEYCLYKTEMPSIKSTKKSSLFKKLNQCGAQTRREMNARKITCKKFRYSKERAVLAITVTGLKPDTAYIFDVFVNKGNYFSFPYNSVRTKTSPTCFLPT